MATYTEDNSRIAKNTVIIYARVILIGLIGFLCTRFAMEGLGIYDYGLYGVVGGTIMMLGFLSTAMNTTTRRFINVEMGRPGGDLGRIFNICLVVHIGLAVLILLLAETIGLYYIYHWMKVDPHRLGDANIVFQISTIAACISIVNLPYQSLVEAHEKFFQSAMVDIIANIFRLAMVICLLFWEGNRLYFYAVGMALMTFLTMAMYHFLCRRQWPEVIKWRFQRGSQTYKEIISFNNYTALSALAYIARGNGSKLIVNYFFGPMVNSAMEPAYQLENFSVTSVNRFSNAAAPQINRNYSGGNTERSLSLVYKMSRYSALLMSLVVFSALVELEFALDLWLKEVPDGALLFTRWTLVSALVRSFVGGTQTLEQATGRIKWFQIWNSVMSLLCLPLSFLAYSLGAPAPAIIQIYIGYSVTYRFVEFWLLHRLIGFDAVGYVRNAYLKPFAVVAVMVLWLLVYRAVVPAVMGPWMRLCGIALTFALCCLACYGIGLYGWERETIRKSLGKIFSVRNEK
ncbi:MAG: lipopolysaccharide biosynthesis protein [Bacteroidales bacterium]|nr:lipopolysaccharide biosynthesis protein [Bacteroidales bacterium]